MKNLGFSYLVEEFLAHNKHLTNVCLINTWKVFSERQEREREREILEAKK